MRPLNKLISFGNSKLPTSTMIFNVSTATACPSRARGMCLVSDSCYAARPERDYRAKNVLPYRQAQQSYWLNTSADQIIADLDNILSRKRKLPTHLRYNEAGDFHSQACVDKMSKIARHLFNQYGIITYGYSARKDLDFSKSFFLCKSSGYNNGNNGCTRVIGKKEEKPRSFLVCPGSCKKCSACTTRVNIAFRKH